ncbi:DGQHR domain-containing protein [Janthinobacterium sp. FW305-128]|uniref:DGQHR domain-containing protein n=1 Tax=Janthinobacterium sp. FW305-128 TaxID=2775055 RepID=UPI001E3CF843|nr:DGQHR domain-containing protein [Janthinobacterium sp. FW305-128]MCC7684056.1 DGQHR domain-containing protein [Janthinobacterium sp. FW305-128]
MMEYPCLVFNQKDNQQAPKFCIFEAPVSNVLSWATIPRLSPDKKGGIQRAKNDIKVRGIKKFLESDPRNTIPTAIVITVASNSYNINSTETTTKIDIIQGTEDGIFVVDGQHRLYGLHEFDPHSRVPIVAILEASEEERAFQFIVINNKVSKVAPDHIRALTLNFTNPDKEQGLEKRLNLARLSLNKNLTYVGMANTSEDSPFKGIVGLPDTQEDSRIIIPASIETSVAYIQSKNIIDAGNSDASYDLFIAIWNTIKTEWGNTFSQGKSNKLLSKIGIFCMTKYIVDTIDILSSIVDISIDLTNLEDVTNAVKKILQLQKEEFWSIEWNISIADTKLVREQVIESMRKINQNMKNKHPWETGVPVLPRTDN